MLVDGRALEHVGVDPAVVGRRSARPAPRRSAAAADRRGTGGADWLVPCSGLREEEPESERADDEDERSEIADAPFHQAAGVSRGAGPSACTCSQTRRKRRRVIPEPAAPTSRLTATRISATIGKLQAWMSSRALDPAHDPGQRELLGQEQQDDGEHASPPGRREALRA